MGASIIRCAEQLKDSERKRVDSRVDVSRTPVLAGGRTNAIEQRRTGRDDRWYIGAQLRAPGAGTVKRSDLLALIAGGENSGVEFKRDDVRPEQLAKEVVALANFQGGRILVGVEDDGAISGIRRDHLERWVMDAVFGQAVHPMMLPFYEEVPIDDARRVAGVRNKIIPSMRVHNGVDPEFEATEDHLRLTLRRRRTE